MSLSSVPKLYPISLVSEDSKHGAFDPFALSGEIPYSNSIVIMVGTPLVNTWILSTCATHLSHYWLGCEDTLSWWIFMHPRVGSAWLRICEGYLPVRQSWGSTNLFSRPWSCSRGTTRWYKLSFYRQSLKQNFSHHSDALFYIFQQSGAMFQTTHLVSFQIAFPTGCTFYAKVLSFGIHTYIPSGCVCVCGFMWVCVCMSPTPDVPRIRVLIVLYVIHSREAHSLDSQHCLAFWRIRIHICADQSRTMRRTTCSAYHLSEEHCKNQAWHSEKHLTHASRMKRLSLIYNLQIMSNTRTARHTQIRCDLT